MDISKLICPKPTSWFLLCPDFPIWVNGNSIVLVSQGQYLQVILYFHTHFLSFSKAWLLYPLKSHLFLPFTPLPLRSMFPSPFSWIIAVVISQLLFQLPPLPVIDFCHSAAIVILYKIRSHITSQILQRFPVSLSRGKSPYNVLQGSPTVSTPLPSSSTTLPLIQASPTYPTVPPALCLQPAHPHVWAPAGAVPSAWNVLPLVLMWFTHRFQNRIGSSFIKGARKKSAIETNCLITEGMRSAQHEPFHHFLEKIY